MHDRIDLRTWQSKLKLSGGKNKSTVRQPFQFMLETGVWSLLGLTTSWLLPVLVQRNLGVLFASDLKIEDQVSAICRSCAFQIHKVGRIVKFLTPKAVEQLVHSFITSKLGACNSLLYLMMTLIQLTPTDPKYHHPNSEKSQYI